MNINTLLINEEYIKRYSNVSDNLDSNLITSSILDSQLSGLQPLIGTKLYDKLCELVENETITDTDNEAYKTLIDNYISQYLLYKTISEMTVDNFSKLHNAGNVQYVDTNYQQTPLNEVKYLRQHWDDKAAFYAERLTDYLHANHSSFPEYCQVDNCSDMRAKQQNYACGINLSKSRQRKRKDR